LAGFSNNFEGLWSIADHKIRAYSLENQRVAVGVSGGADSIGLFHVFSSLLKQKKISDLVVFHINFGLRGSESDLDEAFVRSICEEADVSFSAFHPNLEKGSGVQERARLFRQSIQNKFIEKGFIVALAHNADDVAENILLRLARGSSLENAAGMRFFSDQIFRPWLEVPRLTIREAIKSKGITWREDSSNTTTIYARNKIRLEVMPVLESLFPGVAKRLAGSFLRPSEVTAGSAKSLTTDSIPMSALGDLALATLGGAVHDFLSTHFEGRSPVQRQVISQIATAIHRISTGLDGESRLFQLPGQKKLIVSRLEIRIQSGN
jgi:tRNA(Ile)-lysidine synthetase-like protein